MAIAITGITPATGPTTGGTVHYITGTDLDTVTSVKFGTADAPLFEALSATLMKVTAPAGTAGALNIVLGPGAVTLTGGFTYEAPTESEQLVSTLARKFKLQVNTGTPTVPAWVTVRAILDFKPMLESNLEDDSDYDGEGWASETKTQLKWGAEVKVGRKIGFSTGVYDPGQEVLRTAAVKFGGDGTKEIRYFDRDGGPEAYQGYVNVSWEPEGGDTKTNDIVTIKLSGSGKRTDIVNPAA